MTSGVQDQRGPPREGDQPERSDIAARPVAFALVGLIGALLLVCALVAGLFILLDRGGPPRSAGVDARLTPPEPRLQVDETVQRVLLERRAADGLRPAPNRIGIDEAMRRTAADGWPQR